MQFYDAVLVLSFGGPESPDEVRPFLEHVTRGRGIPAERLDEVATHYLARGGVSPINGQVRALLAALTERFSARGAEVPLYWGNRNSQPWLVDALRQIHADGHRRVLTLLTSAFPSYSGCRQYRENLHDACAEGGIDLEIDVMPAYGEHDGFVTANVDAVRDALEGFDEPAHIAFVTHSIPEAMAAASGPTEADAYNDSHLAVAERIVDALEPDRIAAWSLVYCSRSGPPQQPWLEPDINDHLRALADAGVTRVVMVPVGFISDHMEVLNDLDEEAMETATELGLQACRAGTVGTHPAFVDALIELVFAQDAAASRQQPFTGPGRAWRASERCSAGCCANLRDPGKAAMAERSGAVF